MKIGWMVPKIFREQTDRRTYFMLYSQTDSDLLMKMKFQVWPASWCVVFTACRHQGHRFFGVRLFALLSSPLQQRGCSAFIRCFLLNAPSQSADRRQWQADFHLSALLSLCLVIALGFLSNKADTDDMRHDNSWDLTEAAWTNREKIFYWPSPLKSLSSSSSFHLAWFQMK